MNKEVDINKFNDTLANVVGRLKSFRNWRDHWSSNLSSSALSTATAVFALSKASGMKHRRLVNSGLDWLRDNANSDGGWGDTIDSVSNISTTMLCWSAFTVADDRARYAGAVSGAEKWLADYAGTVEPDMLVDAVYEKYGKDRTFSVPILTMCALAGRLGASRNAWSYVKPLPFEFAAFPHWFFKWLRLSVVSYALPALIAMGQVSFYHRKPRCPVKRLLRRLARKKTLKVLQAIQPGSGGFLEAAPLTGFVIMSLVCADQKDNSVVTKGVNFLVNTVRDDGSWPIDTNLDTWVTTLSVNALASGSDFESALPVKDRAAIAEWLSEQQYRSEHPYTHASPGGWAWTDLTGGVPDADDTAGGLIAMSNLEGADRNVLDAAGAGVNWLIGLQNSDGGIPTFCRGWAKLPFDRSAPDLTAHSIAAMNSWFDKFESPLQTKIDRVMEKALKYLAREQRPDGSWIPLWFGNQAAPGQENPTYGTARVITGLNHLSPWFISDYLEMVKKAVDWLISAQNDDGGWGGDKAVKSSIEETALAIDAMAGLHNLTYEDSKIILPAESIRDSVMGGVNWLIEKSDDGRSMHPSPIGLYFAKLWYSEKLYPWIFTASALLKVQKFLHRLEAVDAQKKLRL